MPVAKQEWGREGDDAAAGEGQAIALRDHIGQRHARATQQGLLQTTANQLTEQFGQTDRRIRRAYCGSITKQDFTTIGTPSK